MHIVCKILRVYQPGRLGERTWGTHRAAEATGGPEGSSEHDGVDDVVEELEKMAGPDCGTQDSATGPGRWTSIPGFWRRTCRRCRSGCR